MKNCNLIIMAILSIVGGTPSFANEEGGEQLQKFSDVKPTQNKKALAVFNDLMAVMEDTTEIATKTKMNADWVPGIVTVLKGDDLDAQGFHTVKDALSMAPGVTTTLFENNDLVVRGVGKPGSGKLKILLNGISITDTATGLSNSVMLMPIEAVERIEVIRGTGAVMYGENAYTGVINVITRKEGQRIFGNYGHFETYRSGGIFSHINPENSLTMSLNLAGFRTHGDNIESGPDALAVAHQPESFAPGLTNEKISHQSAIFNLDYQNFSLVAQYLQRRDNFIFGVTDHFFPPADSNIDTPRQYSIEAKQKFHISPNIQSSLKLGELISQTMVDKMYVSPFPINIRPIFGSGIFNNNFVKEQRLYGVLDFSWIGWHHHILTLNLDYSYTKLIDSWQELNIDLNTTPFTPLTKMRRYKNVFKDDIARQNIGIIIQDQFEYSDRLTITSGMRVDHYNDVGNSLNPRLALAYQLAEHHILKTQFSTAFRSPTFLEMYLSTQTLLGNPNLKPETIRTYEAGYIYRDADTVGRVTLFQSKMKDLISIIDNVYINTTGANLSGTELELEKKLTSKFKMNANLSYVKTKDLITEKEIANSANWLSNLEFIYRPGNDYLLALHYGFVGDRNREASDTRDKLGSNHTVNLTGSISNLWQKGLTLRLGANNFFNSDVRLSSPANTYPEDYPRAGREWWMSVTYDF
ncbi:iron complex outermembrane recepter protein [Gammaproteobacteria bacterium]